MNYYNFCLKKKLGTVALCFVGPVLKRDYHCLKNSFMTQSGFVLPALKSWSPFKNERMENGGSLKWQDHNRNSLLHIL